MNVINIIYSWLFSTIFSINITEKFILTTTWIELIGFITGAVCVYGVVKQKIWNYYYSLVNCLAWLVLFWSYGLYMDAVLQAAFIGLTFYGWWQWVYGGSSGRNTLKVRRVARKETGMLTILTVVFIIVTSCASYIFQLYAFKNVQQTFILDASILVLSLVATYMQAKKILESWWVWIAVDIVSVPLYFYKQLSLTGIIYIVFLILCIQGLNAWKQQLNHER